MNPELAKNLIESPQGQALREFIIFEIDKLDSVTDIDGSTAEMIALDVKASKLAIKHLEKMFEPLIGNTQFAIMEERDGSITTEMLNIERSQESNQE